MIKTVMNLMGRGADASPLAPDAVAPLYRQQRFRVMTAITIGYGLSYTCRLTLGVVKKPLIDAGIFSAADLGLIGSALFYSYAFGKLTNGFLADHANAKRLFAIGLMLSALANIAMGLSTSVAAAVIIWGLNGWFQSFGAPASVVALSHWFSNRERGRYYGIWASSHSLGEGLTFAVTGTIVALFGWRFGYFAPAALCLVTALFVYAWLQDRPQTLGLPPIADYRNDRWSDAPEPETKDAAPVWRTQFSILKMPAVWIIALSSALAYVTRYALDSWGVLYLQEARGYSLPAAGSLMAISTIAGLLGAIAFGFISDKLFGARRPPVNLLFSLIQIAGLLLIFYGPTNSAVLTLGMILFGLGMTGLFTSIGGLFATDICPKRVAGAALGMVGVFSYIGAGLQEQLSGHLLEHSMRMVDGVRHYDFSQAIIVWVGASVASMLLAATLWKVKLRD
jgi:OPA family sugar phosphate sensor protein UhpC-like MFS transporter